MRILHVNKFLYPFGGAESYMFELAKAQKSIGHEVSFWGMEDEKNTVKDNFNCFAPTIDYHVNQSTNPIKRAIQTIYSSENNKRIGILLDKFQPDIVHLHNFNYQLTPSILPAIKKRGAKIVYTAHDSQFVCPWHRLYNFQKETQCTKCVEGSFFNCIKDRCFNGSIARSTIGALESYYYHTNKYYDNYVDLIISPSNFLANLIKKRINVPIKVVPNFVDWSLNFAHVDKQDYLLYFGRVSEEKGILETLKHFVKNKINVKIIGTGPDVNKIQENSFIQYLGPKYGSELQAEISKAKFVVLPSKWYENCPMTVIESFACATPVLASDHSGFKELIVNDFNGYRFDFNKPNTYEKISKLIKDYEYSLAENAKKDYFVKYAKDNHIKNIISLYNNLLS